MLFTKLPRALEKTDMASEALEHVKAFMAPHAAFTADMLVINLTGKGITAIDAGIKQAANELYAALHGQPWTRTVAFGLTAGFVDMVHDRLRAQRGWPRVPTPTGV